MKLLSEKLIEAGLMLTENQTPTVNESYDENTATNGEIEIMYNAASKELDAYAYAEDQKDIEKMFPKVFKFKPKKNKLFVQLVSDMTTSDFLETVGEKGFFISESEQLTESKWVSRPVEKALDKGSAAISLGHSHMELTIDSKKWSLSKDGDEIDSGTFKDERDLIQKLKTSIKKHDPKGFRDETMAAMSM